MLAYTAKKYSFHLKIGFIVLWILLVFYFIKFQEVPRRTYHGFIRSKIMFGYCLDVDGFGELSLTECQTEKSPRWHLRKNFLSENISRKCVSYDLNLVACNQASKWSYDIKNKWIVNENTHQCLTLDYTSKTLHLWECSKDHDFNKWEFIMQSFEIENHY